MEFFQTTELTVPLVEIMVMLSLSTIVLLIGRIKLALMMSYVFALYWCYVSNADLVSSIENADVYNSVYIGFGIVVVLLAVTGFIAHNN